MERFGGYAASKAALAMICKTLALELGPDGIRVNGVFPGYIWADAVQMYFAHKASQRGVDPQVVYDEIAAETALGYIPTSEEIAGTIVFFASEPVACLHRRRAARQRRPHLSLSFAVRWLLAGRRSIMAKAFLPGCSQARLLLSRRRAVSV